MTEKAARFVDIVIAYQKEDKQPTEFDNEEGGCLIVRGDKAVVDEAVNVWSEAKHKYNDSHIVPTHLVMIRVNVKLVQRNDDADDPCNVDQFLPCAKEDTCDLTVRSAI